MRPEPFVFVIRVGGRSASWMTAGAPYASNVILEKEYDPDELQAAV